MLKTEIEIQTLIWPKEQTIDIIIEVPTDKLQFAIGGKNKIHAKINGKSNIRVPIVLCPLKPGPLELPNLVFEVIGDSSGIFFEITENSCATIVMPREESCRRYVKE